ncbi:hypothetical protein [Turneriella parva]|uniref:Uncharacterized protein n=1 Tax=Turneriella parva (strain ATCC BAA-1111 / DSM 21527 / NCTC 11395 / H) TaxID=869212 RepID=I4B3P4_TURPD|nr:hypothetical protein [Turneriella parva]AFM11901.1 hypothetical protein Turpa_1253 [Turneriella parva DSM 21527]
MKTMKVLVLATAMAFFGSQIWADECAALDRDIQEMNLAISHIKEHGEITKEDAKEAARDLKQTKKDLKAMIASGEADAEEAAMAQRAVDGIDECIKGLRKNDMSRVVGGMEQIVSVMHEYRAHAHCGEASH